MSELQASPAQPQAEPEPRSEAPARAGAPAERPAGAVASQSEPLADVPHGPLIERLSAAVVSTARGVRGRWFFIGWTAEGLPAASTTVEDLSEAARRDLANFRGARLEPRKVPFATIIPVSYVITGSAIDFADSPEQAAEDQVSFTVTDASGARRDLAIGEMAILGAIAAAREPWQSHQAGSANMLAVDTVPIYTLFTTLPGVRADTGLAMIFDSTIPGSTNEPAFRSFVRNSLGRLLVLDESQREKQRKGYLKAAGKIAGVPPEGGVLGSLVWMRKAGLVAFEDQWLQKLQGRGRRVKGGLIRALRGIGMVEISDEMLEEISDSRPNYDVDQLDLQPMIDLSSEMHRVAREALTPKPSPAPVSRSDRRRRSRERERERRHQRRR